MPARLLQGLGDADAAVLDFRRVAELDPTNKAAAQEVRGSGPVWTQP